MKYLHVTILFLLLSSFTDFQTEDWIKTEGEITDISFHGGRKTKEFASVKFTLEDGTEISTKIELFRIPFIGSMKSIGDRLIINYSKENPAIANTTSGKFIADYGMYILIVLGAIFSIKPFLQNKNKSNNNSSVNS